MKLSEVTILKIALMVSRNSSTAHSTIRAKPPIPPCGSLCHSVPPPLTRNLRCVSAALARFSAAALLQTFNLFANSNLKGFPATNQDLVFAEGDRLNNTP